MSIVTPGHDDVGASTSSEEHDHRHVGFYTEWVNQSIQLINSAKSTIIQCLDNLQLQSPDCVIGLGDFGTADGGTSMELFRDIIDHLQSTRGKQHPILVVYEEQPRNDFNALFARLHGFIPIPRTYLKDRENVFAVASGTSMFDQCMPPNSLDLAFSCATLHWLSKRPCKLVDTLFPSDGTEEEKIAFARQGAEDWEQFLLCRAKELKPSGSIVLLTFVAVHLDEDKAYRRVYQDTFTSIWRSLVSEGRLSKEEFENTMTVEHCRTEEETRAPFNSSTSSVRKAGLQIESYEEFTNFYSKQQEGQSGETHATNFTNCVRGFFASALTAALSPSRTSEEKEQLEDEFFKRLRAIAVLSPEKFTVCRRMAKIVIRKASDI